MANIWEKANFNSVLIILLQLQYSSIAADSEVVAY